MARKNQKSIRLQASVSSPLSDLTDEREDLSDYRPSDEDRVAPKIPAPAKTEEEARREYEEKCRYLESLPQTFQLDLSEIDCREFVFQIIGPYYCRSQTKCVPLHPKSVQ